MEKLDERIRVKGRLQRWLGRASLLLRQLLSTERKQHQRDFLLEAMPCSGRCAEIGVDNGDFSRRILNINRPKELHLIDPWQYCESDDYSEARYGGERGQSQERMDSVHRSVHERFREEIASSVVYVHRSTSRAAAENFPTAYFDWVYIDGNHLYEFVIEDLTRFLPKVKRGGYLAGDDYGVKGWWDDGVTRAVDEFVESGRVEPVMFRRHQFVLRRP